MYLLVATKDHIPIAGKEIENLLGKSKQEDNFFLIKELDLKLAKRLAYTNFIYEVLTKGSKKTQIKDQLNKLNWEEIIYGTYAVRSQVDKITEKDIASIIWKHLEDPRVSLKKPRSLINVLEFGKEFLVCKKVWENKKEFFKRKPHLRKEFHPTSLDPRLALACINISGVKKGVILDPFVGSGGILIEAGNKYLKTVGFDLDQRMLERTENNLKEQGIRHRKLLRRDATKEESYKVSFDAVVTDVPYGQHSKLHGRGKDELYSNLLKALKKVREKKEFSIVIIFPSDVEDKFVSKFFSIDFVYTYYVHSSLSRKIFSLVR
jgi:tRNA (guanine10-N2)-dimethyltransferase